MDSPSQPPVSPTFKPMTFWLACLAVLAAATAVLPQTVRPWNVAALGALLLFATARLRPLVALGLFGAALAIKELGVYLQYGYDPHPPTWICYAGYALFGWGLLRKTDSAWRIGVFTFGASLLFFLTTNFASWLEQALPYGYSFEGLVNCYVAAIPFYRGTLVGDFVFSAALFGAHAVLSRAYFPAERVGVVVEEVRDTEGHG